jgi:hypothetical protein
MVEIEDSNVVKIVRRDNENGVQSTVLKGRYGYRHVKACLGSHIPPVLRHTTPFEDEFHANPCSLTCRVKRIDSGFRSMLKIVIIDDTTECVD